MDDPKALVVRMRAGDGEATRALVHYYHRPLFAFIYRLTDDRALADDFSQETFIRMARHNGTPPDNVRAWVFTVARNLVYDHYRSAWYRREQAADFDVDIASSSEDIAPEQAAIDADQQAAVAAQIQFLSPEQREVVILRFYHGMSLQDIATVTSSPLGTVKSRLFHALRRLKDGLLVEGVVYE